MHILHVDVTDPSGREVSFYSGNIRAPQGRAEWPLPIAHNDAGGKWDVRVKDLLSGESRTAAIEVY